MGDETTGMAKEQSAVDNGRLLYRHAAFQFNDDTPWEQLSPDQQQSWISAWLQIHQEGYDKAVGDIRARLETELKLAWEN